MVTYFNLEILYLMPQFSLDELIDMNKIIENISALKKDDEKVDRASCACHQSPS